MMPKISVGNFQDKEAVLDPDNPALDSELSHKLEINELSRQSVRREFVEIFYSLLDILETASRHEMIF